MSIPPAPGPHQPPPPHGPYPYPYPWGQAQGPYPPPPGPYGAPPALNGLAIAALVLGVLCFLPAVGLVLGLVALRQIKRRGERGRGMAVAGSVLSSVGLVLWAVTLSTGAASDFWEGFKGAAAGEGTAYALARGDCFDSPTGALEGETYDVEEVPCAGRHDGEVFAVVELPSGDYPGDDRLTDRADGECSTLADRYAMDAWAVPEDVDVYYLVPSRESWRFGDREITCLFGTEGGDGLTGSLRSDATTLDADQLALLTATRAVDDVLYEEPEAAPEDGLAGHRAWAGEVEGVLAAQIEALRGHDWPAGAERPVAGLVKDMEEARAAWGKAAGAGDADTYYAHYDEGYAYVDGPTTVTARKALGLATTPPSYEDDGGDAGGEAGIEV
ncbi:DUF4190 domain-containing protein [Streptomyces sp. NPDC085946]|uniref:DUF4190 domain-containing protein n=1 Tax=Streptomyces sp. NPDC085946 TaxID=3365744 RepID=UPI0037CE99DD